MRNTSIARSVKALVEANASHNVYTNGITAINLPANGAAARVSSPNMVVTKGKHDLFFGQKSYYSELIVTY